ncbi:MAG: hypothetical protein ACRYGA_12675 [Janthinobacterium lividum]
MRAFLARQLWQLPQKESGLSVRQMGHVGKPGAVILRPSTEKMTMTATNVNSELYVDAWNAALSADPGCAGLLVVAVPPTSDHPSGYAFEPPAGREADFLRAKTKIDEDFAQG